MVKTEKLRIQVKQKYYISANAFLYIIPSFVMKKHSTSNLFINIFPQVLAKFNQLLSLDQ